MDQTIHQGLRVLVVEDNVVNREVILALLDTAGINAECVVDGHSAIEHYSKEPPFELILMDLHMPGIDGLQTTRIIRELEATQNKVRVPIIAVTANVMPEIREACTQAGMDAFIPKPIFRDELLEVIDSVVMR